MLWYAIICYKLLVKITESYNQREFERWNGRFTICCRQRCCVLSLAAIFGALLIKGYPAAMATNSTTKTLLVDVQCKPHIAQEHWFLPLGGLPRINAQHHFKGGFLKMVQPHSHPNWLIFVLKPWFEGGTILGGTHKGSFETSSVWQAPVTVSNAISRSPCSGLYTR